jgi:hypothetical protein
VSRLRWVTCCRRCHNDALYAGTLPLQPATQLQQQPLQGEQQSLCLFDFCRQLQVMPEDSRRLIKRQGVRTTTEHAIQVQQAVGAEAAGHPFPRQTQQVAQPAHPHAIETIDQALFPVEHGNRECAECVCQSVWRVDVLFTAAARQAERRQRRWRTGQPGCITERAQPGTDAVQQGGPATKQREAAPHLQQQLTGGPETDLGAELITPGRQRAQRGLFGLDIARLDA